MQGCPEQQQLPGLPLHQQPLVEALRSDFLLSKLGMKLAAGPKPAVSRCATCGSSAGARRTCPWSEAVLLELGLKALDKCVPGM